MKRSLERRGFTMVELLLAVGLLSILFVALVRLVDTSLKIWGRTESNRDLLEIGGSVLDLYAEDLLAVEGGPRGDFLAEWFRFDVDRDGTAGLPWSRVRFVRQVSAAELRRLSPDENNDPRARGLVEVCWVVLPPGQVPPDERPLGVLWRGVRSVNDEDSVSFFDERFFASPSKPAAGSLNVVTGGVLWVEPWFAAQTSIVHEGWKIGEALGDCASSWDAWGRDRPDQELSYLNAPAAGMPEIKDVPVLPRRIRLALEIERLSELKLRPRLTSTVDHETSALPVADETRLPADGELILVDEEWMQILSRSPGQASVLRGQRGTRPAVHDAGALVHFGNRIVREIPIAARGEDWDL